MTLAWGMTEDDVLNAIDSNKHNLSKEFMDNHGLTQDDTEGAANHAYNAIVDRSDEVEKAALYGDDMDDQVCYAHNEIVSILVEEKILIPRE